MNNIQASPSPTALQPAWAAAHLLSDDGRRTFIGAESALEVSAPDGSDVGRTYASLEQVDGLAPAIRLQGADDQPMTLAQAWQQAAILQGLVLAALGGAR